MTRNDLAALRVGDRIQSTDPRDAGRVVVLVSRIDDSRRPGWRVMSEAHGRRGTISDASLLRCWRVPTSEGA